MTEPPQNCIVQIEKINHKDIILEQVALILNVIIVLIFNLNDKNIKENTS